MGIYNGKMIRERCFSVPPNHSEKGEWNVYRLSFNKNLKQNAK